MKKYKIYILGILFTAYFAVSLFGEDKKNVRVVSLSPNLTELVFYLGEEGQLVGRSSACDYPPEVKKIPSVGGFGKPSLEQLISLKPDVVIASALADPGLKNSIEQLGVKFYMFPGKSLEDYYTTVAVLGRILNCRKKADKEIRRVKEGIANFANMNKLPKKKSVPKVYLEVWNRPYMTVGNRSFINDIIEYAGGRNIAAAQSKDYFNCSVEWIITSRPDIIICPAMKNGDEADVKQRKGWQSIPAVKNNRIYVNFNPDLIYRLGPRILEGIACLRKIITDEK